MFPHPAFHLVTPPHHTMHPSSIYIQALVTATIIWSSSFRLFMLYPVSYIVSPAITDQIQIMEISASCRCQTQIHIIMKNPIIQCWSFSLMSTRHRYLIFDSPPPYFTHGFCIARLEFRGLQQRADHRPRILPTAISKDLTFILLPRLAIQWVAGEDLAPHPRSDSAVE